MTIMRLPPCLIVIYYISGIELIYYKLVVTLVELSGVYNMNLLNNLFYLYIIVLFELNQPVVFFKGF